MRKTLLILSLFLIGFTDISAQKTKVSWGTKAGLTITDAAPEFEILGTINGNYYSLIKHFSNSQNKTSKICTRLTLLKFDGSHNLMFSKDIIPEAGSGFLKAFTYQDHFQFFYQGLDEKKKIALYTQEIGLEGNELSVPQLIDSESPTKPGFETYNIELFDNDKYLVSYNFQYDQKTESILLNSKSIVIVFSSLYQKIFESEIGAVTKDSKILFSQLFGADNGNLVFLNTSPGKAKNEFKNQIAEYNYETKEYRKIDLGITDKNLKFCQNENQFILISLASRDESDASVKLLFQNVDRESFKTDNAIEIGLDNNNEGSYLASTEEFSDSKSKEIKPLKKFYLSDIQVKKNGNIILRINESTLNGTKHISNTGNVLFVNLDVYGKYVWSKMIQRQNQLTETNPDFASVLSFEIGGNMYFLFNDVIDNQKADGTNPSFVAKPMNVQKPQTAIVSWVGISSTGKFSKGVIEDISNLERSLYFNPQLSKIDSNGVGVLLLMGIDKTKLGYKLGTIKFSID